MQEGERRGRRRGGRGPSSYGLLGMWPSSYGPRGNGPHAYGPLGRWPVVVRATGERPVIVRDEGGGNDKVNEEVAAVFFSIPFVFEKITNKRFFCLNQTQGARI